MWLPWYWMQSRFDIWLTAQMAFGLLFPVEFEVIEVILNSSEGNQAENIHLKWKGKRESVYIGKQWREKKTYKKVYKIVKWSIAFLYDHQLQICLVSEIFQVNSFYSLNKFFPGEDVILVWNQVPPQPLYICNKVDFSKARLLVLHVSGNKNPEVLVQHYGNVNNSPKVFPSCPFLRKLSAPDKIGRTDIMK